MRYYPISNQIRKLANTLQEKESFDIRGLLSKIPGLKLPTKEQAADILLKFISEKGPAAEGIINRITDTVTQSLTTKTASRDVNAGFMDTLKGLKALANPSVILATIALMGALNTAEAGPLLDRIKAKGQQEVSQQQTPESNKTINIIKDLTPNDNANLEVFKAVQKFLDSNEPSGLINIGGQEFVFGVATGDNIHMMKTMADNRALSAKAKSSPTGVHEGPGAQIFKRFHGQLSDGSQYIVSVGEAPISR